MKIRLKLILMIVMPMLISGLAIEILSTQLAKNYLNNEQETILKTAIEGYSGDVNAYQELDIDITVFKGDTRAESSIKNAVGTKASQKVIDVVLNGKEEYFDTNIDVNGTAYYGYYMPTSGGMLFAGKPQTVVAKNLNSMSLYVLIICIALLAVFGIIGFLAAGNMAKQIQAVSKSIKSIAEGDLSVGTHLLINKSKDELGDTSKAAKQMSEKLSNIMQITSQIGTDVNISSQNLHSASETTLSAVTKVTKSMEEIAAGLQNQNDSVQNMAGNLNEMNLNIDGIKSAAIDISNSSELLNRSGNSMKQKMTNMSDSNKKVNESIANISDRIQSITQVIDNVKGIISVIGDISSQTQLLSLNASIEAARAGDAGKGFAVVADSISGLSEDTNQQVDQITNIINTLVDDFDECIKTIDETVEDGNAQKKDLESVIEGFEELISEISETSEKVEHITVSINKSVKEMSCISQEIEELSSISESSVDSTQKVNVNVEEINTLMNKVASTAEELNSKAEQLNKQLGFFKIANKDF